MELILWTSRQLARFPGRLQVAHSQRKSTATQPHQRPHLKLPSLQRRQTLVPQHILALAARHAPSITKEMHKMLSRICSVI